MQSGNVQYTRQTESVTIRCFFIMFLSIANVICYGDELIALIYIPFQLKYGYVKTDNDGDEIETRPPPQEQELPTPHRLSGPVRCSTVT